MQGIPFSLKEQSRQCVRSNISDEQYGRLYKMPKETLRSKIKKTSLTDILRS